MIYPLIEPLVTTYSSSLSEPVLPSFSRSSHSLLPTLSHFILSLGKEQLSLQSKNEFIHKLSHQFSHLTPALPLKEAIATAAKVKNWKDAIYGATYHLSLNIHYPLISYDNGVHKPIRIEERSLFIEGQHSAALFGSTFSTGNPNRHTVKGNHLLDTGCSAICYDMKGDYTGFAVAIGDGAGGHFGDDRQDSQIARSSHIATKGVVRYLSLFHDPDKLKEALQEILDLVKQDVQAKVFGEGTTLACCRAFPSNSQLHVVGATIGDSMIVAWDPHSKQFFNLAPSHVSEAGTAIFPTAYRKFEVHSFEAKIPLGSFLFALTDGAHDHLPFTQSSGTYPNGLTLRTRSLDEDKMQLLLSGVTEWSPKAFLNAIGQQIFQTVETEREKGINRDPHFQVGDDAGIICSHLSLHQIQSLAASGEGPSTSEALFIQSTKAFSFHEKKGLLEISFHELENLEGMIKTCQPVEVVFQKCHPPLNEVLPLLPKNLKSLSFQKCSSLNSKILSKIPDFFPHLKKLNILSCEKLCSFENPAFFTAGTPLSFPNLQVLQIEDSSLTKIRLETPKLAEIQLRNNSELKLANLKAPFTASFDSTANPRLNVSETLKLICQDERISLIPSDPFISILFQLYSAYKTAHEEKAPPLWARVAQHAWNSLTEEKKKEFALNWLKNSPRSLKEELHGIHFELLETILGSLTRITTLSLRGIRIHKNIKPLQQLPKSLEVLDLSYNNLDKESMKELMPILAELQALKFLDLSGNDIGKEGIEVLINRLSLLKSLEELDLTDQSLEKSNLEPLLKIVQKHHPQFKLYF